MLNMNIALTDNPTYFSCKCSIKVCFNLIECIPYSLNFRGLKFLWNGDFSNFVDKIFGSIVLNYTVGQNFQG